MEMKDYARDALARAEHLAELERAARVLTGAASSRRDLRAWIAAAVALLLSLYPGVSAAALTFPAFL